MSGLMVVDDLISCFERRGDLVDGSETRMQTRWDAPGLFFVLGLETDATEQEMEGEDSLWDSPTGASTPDSA